MTPEELDKRCCDVLGFKYGQFESHDWILNDDGSIDLSASDDYDHTGPMCSRCYYSFCDSCDPDGYDKQPCVVKPLKFSNSHMLANRLLDHIDVRHLRMEFMINLFEIVGSNKELVDVMWSVLNATPEQIAYAFIITIGKNPHE